MGKYLDICRKLDEQRKAEQQTRFPVDQKPQPDYRALYHGAAEAITDDCLVLDPAWLLQHPERWAQIRALDDCLTEMEHAGASAPEYQATLAQLVNVVRQTHGQYRQEQQTRAVQ